MMCLKSKRGPEGSRERDVHHKNAIHALSTLFGAAKHFIPKNSEGESESTKYSDIQSEYIGNLTKVKLLEARVMGCTTSRSYSQQDFMYGVMKVMRKLNKLQWTNGRQRFL